MYGNKISELTLATWFSNSDLLTIVQEGENKKIDGVNLYGSIGTIFATKDDLHEMDLEHKDLLNELRDYTNSNINSLNNQISNIYSTVNTTMASYYNLLDNAIMEVRNDLTEDIDDVRDTVQSWIDTIDDKASLEAIQDLINRLTINENLLTQLAEIVYELNNGGGGGGGGGTPGYHTQPTSTIYPLNGYYKTQNTSPLSTTDTLNQALGKLESKVDAISSGGGSGMLPVIKVGENTIPTDGNLYTAAKTKEEFLSKKVDDTALGKITMMGGSQWGQIFTAGFMGVGAAMYKDGSNWNLEVDNLFVRKQMNVNELIVNEIKATGGEILVSLSDMKIVNVIEQTTYWRAYGEKDSLNQFRVYDQAICQKFDGNNVKRYWRLVTNVGSDAEGPYVDLSKSDCEPGSSPVEVGDTILQLGNRNDSQRRSAIFISAQGAAGPNITMYDNIFEYSLDNKDRTAIGKHSKFVGTLFQTTQTGDLVPVPIDRGAYVPGNTYYHYDRVSHNGSLWLCMALETTEAPDKTKPDVWLEQVSKGETGTSGGDAATWVEIIGSNLFLYDNTDFTGTPNPDALIQNCTTYNLTNPAYTWTVVETSTVIGTSATCSILPTVFPENVRTVRVRCSVVADEGSFYDETQIARLSNGDTGESAYYLDLSNPNVSIPYDASGNNPLIPLNSVSTMAKLYHGVTEVIPTATNFSVIAGLADMSIVGNTFTLISLGSSRAQIRITLTHDGNEYFKDMWITKVFNGADGEIGKDAAYLMVTGEQLFRVAPDGNTVTPHSITLNAATYNMQNPSFQWYWSIAGENNWQIIMEGTSRDLIVANNQYGFANDLVNEVSFKCIATPEFSATEYFDLITINKLRDGKDGEGAYRAILSNENQTVPSDYLGNVTPGDIALVVSNFTLWYGSQELVHNDTQKDYTIRAINPNPLDTSQVDLISNTKTVKLLSLDKNYNITTFKIEFLISGSVVDVVDFTISKAKGAAPADWEASVYAYKTSAPSRPTFTVLPASGGTSGPDGTYWYTNPPSGRPLWICTATMSGTTDLTISPGWSTPRQFTGTDGQPGQQGEGGTSIVQVYARAVPNVTPSTPTGGSGTSAPSGWSFNPSTTSMNPLWMSKATVLANNSISGGWSTPVRVTGTDGQQGPGLTFRGLYSSSKQYYSTAQIRDVVRNGAAGQYYTCIKTPPNTGYGPGLTEFWKVFDGTFESIATGLLFADQALISEWWFSNSAIRATTNRAIFNGSNSDTVSGSPIIALGSEAAVWDTSTTPGRWVPSRTAAIKMFGGGTITVGNGQTESTAGISGGDIGPNSVRFWAGSEWKDRNDAPFRVTQDGSVTMKKATIQSNPSGERLIISSSDRSLSFVDASDQVYGTFGFAPVSWPGGESQPKSPELRLGKVGDTRSYVSQFGFMVSNSKYSGSYGYQSMRISDNSSLFVSFGFNISTLAVQLSGLPTTAPAFGSGKVWRDGTTLKITV